MPQTAVTIKPVEKPAVASNIDIDLHAIDADLCVAVIEHRAMLWLWTAMLLCSKWHGYGMIGIES